MKQLAVLGSPIDQALSPVLHRAAYKALGLDWTYQAIDCTPDRLAAFLDSLDSTWAGLSLTMPLKRTVVPLLDGPRTGLRPGDGDRPRRQTGLFRP
ncbi:hypothetical protein [Streptomyces sp. NPDC021020]|uniref:hypothetical protein n=1 Tax=Streptomyces sp. NPDC021020 TaxID=3365109 RepID=UPI0037B7C437